MHLQSKNFAGAFFTFKHIYLKAKLPDKQRTDRMQKAQGKA